MCKSRHLLRRHALTAEGFKAANAQFLDHGLRLSQGTLVDASLRANALATKKKGKGRDPPSSSPSAY